MAYEPGIEITAPAIEFGTPWVSPTSAAYADGLEITAPEIELGAYYAEAPTPAYFPGLELTPPDMLLGASYFGPPLPSTYNTGFMLYAYALPVTPGDTGIEIGVGFFASFTATPVSGIEPLTVQFTNLSPPDADEFYWLFGDGSESYEFEPSHVYYEGSYDVTLRILSGSVYTSYTIPSYITATAKPGTFIIQVGTSYDAYGNKLMLDKRAYESLDFPSNCQTDSDGPYAFLCMRKKDNYYGSSYIEVPDYGFAVPSRKFTDVEFYLSSTVQELTFAQWPYKAYYPPLDDQGMIDGVVLAKIWKAAGVPPNMVFKSPWIRGKDGTYINIPGFTPDS